MHETEVRETRCGRDHEPVFADQLLLPRRPDAFDLVDHLVGITDIAHAFVEVAPRELVGGSTSTLCPVGGPVLAFLRSRLAEKADLDDRRVRVRGVVHVPGEVLGADLPVGLDSPALRSANLQAALTLLGVEVHIEPEVAEEFLEWLRARIQIDEDQAVIAREIRCGKQGLTTPGEPVVAAVGFPMERETG